MISSKKRIKVLVLYRINYKEVRNTIYEHLYSFKNYYKDADYHYFNALSRVPKFLKYVNYDAVIIHYTFLAERFHTTNRGWSKFIEGVKLLKGYKVAIPQDEYDESEKLRYLLKTSQIKTVFTCFTREKDWKKVYFQKDYKPDCFIPVLTGYVEEKELDKIKKIYIDYEKRPIDIGYRGRKLPFYYGKHGQLKYVLTEVFLSKLNNDFIIDISNTEDNSGNTFYGKQWYEFLIKCRAFLGSEGGASIFITNDIKSRVNSYVRKNPQAKFEEIEKEILHGFDYNIKCFTISPRHFEAAMTRTLQVLVAGKYNGILKANVHYLAIKKDFSNIDNILGKLKNEKYCKKIIDRAYKDIIRSKKYSYRVFANLIINHLEKNKKNADGDAKSEFIFSVVGGYLIIRNLFLVIMIDSLYYFIYYPLRYLGIYNKIRQNKKLFFFIKRIIPFN